MKLKKLQTNYGGEYLSNQFTTHLRTCSMVCSLTIHDTSEENRVSKQLNCTLLKHTCAMLLASDLLKFLWTETIQHATWIKNHMAKHILDGKTLYEMVFKLKHHLEDLPEWGSHLYILHKGCRKLKERADQACWVGYSGNTQGHRVYWPGKRHVVSSTQIQFKIRVLHSEYYVS